MAKLGAAGWQLESEAKHADAVVINTCAFIDPANRGLLEERGVTLWLDCSFPRICTRMDGQTHRPLARDPDKFRQLYDERRDAYSQAEYRIEADTDDAAAVVAEILKLPIF